MDQYPPLNTRTDYELKNTQGWLNGEPTTIAEIRDSGRVVLVDFLDLQLDTTVRTRGRP